MAVKGVARKASGAHHQAVLVGDGDADLAAPLVGLTGFAFADAVHLWGVQGEHLGVGLVLGLLLEDATDQGQQGLERGLCARAQIAQLALHLSDKHTQDSSLAFDDTTQALELFGVGVATGTPAQCAALFVVGLLEGQAAALGQAHELLAGHLQQSAVRGVGNGLLLHGGVHDHALQIGLLEGLQGHGGVDGGLQEFFHTGLAQVLAKAADKAGVAGQAVLKVLLATEELKQHVLRPALHHLVIAKAISVLEVQQAEHQADRQTRAPRWADAHAGDLGGGAKQVRDWRKTPHAGLAHEKRGHAGFDLIPGHAGGQHGQGVEVALEFRSS